MAYAMYNPTTDAFDVFCGLPGCPAVVASVPDQEAADDIADNHEDEHADQED